MGFDSPGPNQSHRRRCR